VSEGAPRGEVDPYLEYLGWCRSLVAAARHNDARALRSAELARCRRRNGASPWAFQDASLGLPVRARVHFARAVGAAVPISGEALHGRGSRTNSEG